MGIRFLCEHCNKRLNVKSFLAGKKGLCPHCGGRIRIPLESQVATTSGGGNRSVGSGDENESGERSDASWSAFGDSQTPAARVVDAAGRAQGAVWYVSPPGGGQYGPAPRETVEQWISEGRITADTLVWCDGWDEWEVASRHFVQFQLGEPTETGAEETVDNRLVPSGVEAALPAEPLDPPSTGTKPTKYVLGRSAGYRGARQRSFLWIGIFSFLAVLLLGALALVLIFGSS